MPDLFVAPDELQADPHKRVPMPDQSPLQNEPIRASSQQTPIKPVIPENRNVQVDKISGIAVPQHTSSPLIQRAVVTKKREYDGNDVEKANSVPLFASFWQNPTGVYFDTQEIDEHILLFLRRHPITNLNWILGLIILTIIPPGAFYAFQLMKVPFFVGSTAFTTALIVFYYILIATYAFSQFLTWYYNIALITEKRVIDIELTGLVYKKISATKVALVQDVNYEQTGTIRSVFDYGDVLIQTAGTIDNFYIHGVPKPEVVVRVVEDIIGEEGVKHV